MVKFNLWGRVYNCGSSNGMVAIFDLDGTLSDGTHRLHLLPTKDLHLTESWREFNLASIDDDPIRTTIDVMNAMYKAGYCVIILTGRSDETEQQTYKWLRKQRCDFDFLIMRRSWDNRKDTTIKEEALRAIGLDKIVACWDDSPSVIPHLRNLGLTVYQVVDYGDKVHNHLQSHGVEE